jgi:2-polyprenyl-6-methoxyphenol hydroxylase-like FAD-dependent oxidoreductase
MGRPVRQLSQHDSTVTVGFGDATADCYDLVIGADGIHSTVRRLAVGVCSVQPVGQLAWRFVTECPPDVTTWTVLLGRNVAFLAVPIGRGQVTATATPPSAPLDRMATT